MARRVPPTSAPAITLSEREAITVLVWLSESHALARCDRCGDMLPVWARVTFRRGQARAEVTLCGPCTADLVAVGVSEAWRAGQLGGVATRLGVSCPGPGVTP